MTDTNVALTVAGSDSGGGAGIQADLKTMEAFGVFGTSAVTSLTAQNSTGVRGVHDTPSEFVAEQIDAVVEDFNVTAAKTGMLSNAETARVVAEKIDEHDLTTVVDPVMIAQSGDR
ncbi:MAG: hydroxymethylpyrimidine kinase/phosphomethylpyrimidine kinase, partial [Methanobacteriota archaeon]